MNQPKRQSSGCWMILVLVIILGAVVTIGMGRATSKVQDLFGPPHPRLGLLQRVQHTFNLFQGGEQLLENGEEPKPQQFLIELAEPVKSTCNRLEAQGLVVDGDLVCSYLVYSGKDREMPSGQFTIPPGLSSLAVANRISDPRQKDVVFTIFEGWRREEATQAIIDSGFPATRDDLIAQLTIPAEVLRSRLKIPLRSSLEGYLCPGSYAIMPETNLEGLLIALTQCHDRYLADQPILEGIQNNGLNYHQALTLASIIQRETMDAAEMPLIAGVFYNRLAQGMMLQTDPTVQYALGYDNDQQTWWKSALTLEDLQVDSPYNTYRVMGLPIGPISSPGPEAIRAVAFPQPSDYLYFRAACDGSNTHVFARTFEEHLANACE